jgi:type IV secretory pathway VirJ component
VRVETLASGHHFDGEWHRLATAILGAAGQAVP